MSYRLGLDLGTNSIGWAILKLGSDGRPIEIANMGVRLLTPNQEAGRDPQSNVSLAADRRAARSARRRRDRFLRRQQRLIDTLIKAGLMPQDEGERKALEALDPYALRAKGLDEPLKPHELGRALFHINQRRGFQSNRIADGEDAEKGAMKEGMRKLTAALEEEGARTLGEFLHARHQRREPVRFRPTAQGAKNIYDFYPERAMIEKEIDQLWAAQEPHLAQLTDELLAKLKRIIIAQRPLKKPVVGRCTFRHEEERAPRALPIFQRFRILQDLANLVIERPGMKSRKLTIAERDALAALHHAQASRVVFEKMRKALKLSDDARFNYEGGNREGFDPDQTAAKLANSKLFGKAWRGLERARQTEIVEKLLQEADEEALCEWLETEFNLSPVAAEKIANARLPQGHAQLGRSMLADLVDVMETETRDAVDPATGELFEAPLTYDEAIEALGLHHSDLRPGAQLPKLPYYGSVLTRHVIDRPTAPEGSQDYIGRVPNPTVHIALNQIGKLVNALIDRYGKPSEIVIELARELKWNQKRKEEYNRQLRDNTKANEKRAEKLAELKVDNNGENRLRMRLFEELPPDERVCVFSGEPISYASLFSGAVEIDHILPFSKTLDDGFSNKVLCTREANRRKGNRPPSDAYSEAELANIAGRAERLFKNKSWRFAPDAMDRFEEEGGWQAKHLTDTQHMARLTKTYLGHICDPNKVWAIPGRMTAMLRGLWGLDSLLPGHNLPPGTKKVRTDHRHHAVDAFVIACSDRGLLNRIAREAGRSEALDSDRLFGANGVPEPFDGYERAALREALEKIVVSHKPDHGVQGQLHNETAYGLVDQKIDGKPYNLVTRRALEALKPGEISRIRDDGLREELQRVSERAKREKRKLNDALVEWAREFAEQTDTPQIRRVRILDTREEVITVRHGERYTKAYIPGDNHRIEIYQPKPGVWEGEGVTVFQANQPDAKRNWQANGHKLIMRLHKNDLIEADFGDGCRVYRVCVLDAGNKRVRLAAHNEAGSLQKRHDDPDDSFRWLLKSYEPLRLAKARRVRVGPIGDVSPVECGK